MSRKTEKYLYIYFFLYMFRISKNLGWNNWVDTLVKVLTQEFNASTWAKFYAYILVLFFIISSSCRVVIYSCTVAVANKIERGGKERTYLDHHSRHVCRTIRKTLPKTLRLGKNSWIHVAAVSFLSTTLYTFFLFLFSFISFPCSPSFIPTFPPANPILVRADSMNRNVDSLTL